MGALIEKLIKTFDMSVSHVGMADKISIKVSDLEIVKNQQWLYENNLQPLKEFVDKYKDSPLTSDKQKIYDTKKEQYNHLKDYLNQTSNMVLEHSILIATMKVALSKIELLYDDEGNPYKRLFGEQIEALETLREDLSVLLRAVNV